MVMIVPRNQNNLPPMPASIGHRSLSSWVGIRVHHTGGAFASWKGIHDEQTINRPPAERLAYIGYSFGISDGKVHELRGWDRQPAHDFINTHIGVVFGGLFTHRLPPAEDLAVLVEFIHEARRRCGQPLPISTHRDAAQTECPGKALDDWVKTELPGRLLGDEDMPLTNEDIERIAQRVWARENPSADQSYSEILRGTARRAELAEVRAMMAGLAGQDVAAAAKRAIRREFAALTPVLIAELRAEFGDVVPTDRVETVVRRVLIGPGPGPGPVEEED
jgi:hypothetical protein